jgi:hypothetical protein
MTREEKQQIIKTVLAGWLITGKRYPSSLPEELDPWYCYTVDGGHSILCLLKNETDFSDKSNLYQHSLPVPVKAVLHGYEIKDGWIVVDLPYSSEIGLMIDAGDDEY